MGKGSGGGGGTPTQTTATSYQTNLPEYAQPYVETMLGATQKQLFKMDNSGNITGFQPYQPYSTNPSDYVAGFSPLQQQAQNAVASPQNWGATVSGYMSPYMQDVVNVQQNEAIRQSGIAGQAQQAQAANAGAFGGYREGIERSERERNLQTQLNNIQAQGLQSAYTNAQQQAAQNVRLQSQLGAQQQNQQQQMINQQIQNFANAQQYPLMQLGFMSNMLRGLPMQSTNTNQYVATPNPISQGIGTLGAAYNVDKAIGGKAEGGSIKLAGGGIAGIPHYDVGGSVKAQLSKMNEQQLAEEAQHSSSPIIRRLALEILHEKQMEDAQGQMMQNQPPPPPPPAPMPQPQPQPAPMPMPAAEATPEPQPIPGAARGGIIAFEEGGPTLGEDGTINYSLNPQQLYGSRLSTPSTSSPGAGNPAPDTGAEVRSLARQEPIEEIPLDTRLNTAPAAEGATLNAAPAPAVAAPAAAVPAPAGIATVLQSPEYAAEAKRKQNFANSQGLYATNSELQAKLALAGLAEVNKGSPVLQAEMEKTRGILQQYTDIANKSIKDTIKEDQEALGPNTARDQYLNKLQAERENADTVANQQRHMRMAQFFAKWGSTPGPTLAAGLSALDKSLPDMITDEKDYRKIKDELDKSIYEISEATRAENMGLLKTAQERKLKGAEIAAGIQNHLLQAASYEAGHAATAKGQIVGHAITQQAQEDVELNRAAAGMKEANIRAASVRASQEQNQIYKDEQTLTNLTKVRDAEQAKLDAVRNKQNYIQAQREFNDAKAIFDNKRDPIQRQKMEAAKQQMDALEAPHIRNIQQYEQRIQEHLRRSTGLGGIPPSPTAPAPAPTSAPRGIQLEGSAPAAPTASPKPAPAAPAPAAPTPAAVSKTYTSDITDAQIRQAIYGARTSSGWQERALGPQPVAGGRGVGSDRVQAWNAKARELEQRAKDLKLIGERTGR